MRSLLLILMCFSLTFGAKYYSSHNAAGSGAGTTGDPFTLQELADNTNAGDTGIVMATGVYTISTTIDWDNASAASTSNPAMIFGGDADGNVDGTRPIINGSGLGANANLFNLNVSGLTIKYKYLVIRNSTGRNIEIGSSSDASFIVFDSCLIDSSDDNGILTQETSFSNITFLDCEIANNVGNGFTSNDFGDSRFPARFINCRIHNNGEDGLYLPGNNSLSPVIIGCSIYNNASEGVFLHQNGRCIIMNSVFFNNGSDGLLLDTDTYSLTLFNNIFRSNGGYGVNTQTANVNEFTIFDYNCFSNNTSGATDITTPGANNVTSDPKFTSETAGSEDFSLQSDSPCKDVGFGATN